MEKLTAFFEKCKAFILIFLIVALGLYAISAICNIAYFIDVDADIKYWGYMVLNGLVYMAFLAAGIVTIFLKKKELYNSFFVALFAYVVLSRLFNIFYQGSSAYNFFNSFATLALAAGAVLTVLVYVLKKNVLKLITLLVLIAAAGIFSIAVLINLIDMIDSSMKASLLCANLFNNLSTAVLFIFFAFGVYKLTSEN